MPTSRVVTPPTAAQEPVSLALAAEAVHEDFSAELVNAYGKGNYDATAFDAKEVAKADFLMLQVMAAREKVELYCGRPFSPQTLELTFTLGEEYRLPPGSGIPTSVTGFFTDVEQLPIDGYSGFLEEYRKGISISRELPWGAALDQTYTVTVAIDTTAPAVVKSAILELAAEWYKNRESSINGTISVAARVDWERKLAQWRLTPPAY